MWLKIKSKKVIEIDDNVIKSILNFYPEENLISYPVFIDSFKKQSITIKELKKVSEKILLPWQIFLLNKNNLNKVLDHIEQERKDKVPLSVFLNKRKAGGDITSKRILDRLIRIQNYVSENGSLPKNVFCDSLRGLTVKSAAKHIIRYLDIDFDKIRNEVFDAQKTLAYLKLKLDDKNINLCEGVLSNGMLPQVGVSKSVYKNTSGFAIKSDTIPFIFLPGETKPDEAYTRQIYTLFYLVTGIGLGDFQYLFESKLSYRGIQKIKKEQKFIHNIVSEILLPQEETDKLKTKTYLIDKSFCDKLKLKYKLSIRAIITILRIRGFINPDIYNDIEKQIPKKGLSSNQQFFNTPNISTSVKKFCGNKAIDIINTSIKNKLIFPTQAQYLIFGRSRIPEYKKYVTEMKL